MKVAKLQPCSRKISISLQSLAKTAKLLSQPFLTLHTSVSPFSPILCLSIALVFCILHKALPHKSRGPPLHSGYISLMPSALPQIAMEDHNQKLYSTTANVHFINDPTFNRYDALHVSMELFVRLFPDSEREQTTGSHENGQQIGYKGDIEDRFVAVKLLGAPDYFDTYKLYRVSAVEHDAPTSNSVIFVNNSTLSRFDQQITVSLCVVMSVPPSSIIPLSSVFVSVPSSVYKILSNISTITLRSKLITEFLRGSSGVVNSGDVIRDINGQIILSEPVSHGRIDAETKVVLVSLDHSNEVAEPAERIEVDTEEPENETALDSDIIDLSSYLTNSMHLESKPSTNHHFQARPLPAPVETPTWKKDDPELNVYVTAKAMTKLGFPVFDGDLVNLHHASHTTIVKVHSFIEPNNFSTSFIYLSPILFINLGLKIDEKIYFEPLQAATADQRLSDVIPVAQSVTISRVLSPITMDKTYQTHFFGGLKSVFNEYQKCVRMGDLVPVLIDTVLAKTMFDTLKTSKQEDENNGAEDSGIVPTGDTDAVAWFKIVEVDGDQSADKQIIIDPTKTRLISSGIEYISPPGNETSYWYNYLNLPRIFSYNSVISNDNTVFKYAVELKKILLTCIESNSKVNLRTTVLLNSMTRGLGKATLVRSLAIDLGLNLIELDCLDLINPGAELKTIGTLTAKIEKTLANDQRDEPFHVLFLKHIEMLCVQTNENEQGASMNTSLSLKVIQVLDRLFDAHRNLVIVMSCNDVEKLSDSVRLMVKFQIDLGVPTEAERQEIFRFLIQNELEKADHTIYELYELVENSATTFDFALVNFRKRKDVKFQTLALQSAGLTPRDLISIVKKAKQIAIKRINKLAKSTKTSVDQLVLISSGGFIEWIPEDFNKAINEARNEFSDSIGAPRIPNVKWEDIGGLDLVKDEILDTIDMPLKHPELFSNGVKKRSGILFYGPPGTGKTLLAKAIATNFSLNFFSVKGPELLNMYIGESEANVRRVFQRARDAKPCVIFFDELDSVAPKRGNQGDSGGVMDRIVSQLLAELDGMSGGGENGGDGVFVVGATNRPDLLDEALLRPGRFDKMLYLGISDTDDKQAKIMEALTRKFNLADNVNLYDIAAKCSFTYTGADFYALCSDAMLNAMTRIAGEADKKIKVLNRERKSLGQEEVSTRWWFDNVATKDDTNVIVTMEDFIKSQLDLSPSVSAEELQHYLRVRENFEGGKEKAKESSQLNGISNGH